MGVFLFDFLPSDNTVQDSWSKESSTDWLESLQQCAFSLGGKNQGLVSLWYGWFRQGKLKIIPTDITRRHAQKIF